MRRFLGFLALVVLVTAPSPTQAQSPHTPPTATVEGRVKDEGGGAISGALIQVRRTEEGRPISRESSSLGLYRISGIEPGRYDVLVRHLGYREESKTVTLAANQTLSLDFTLIVAPLAVEGISVEVPIEQGRERVRFEELAGATRRELAGAEMKMVPGVGEADPIRAVEVLPGVVSTSDFSAAFNVRGGSADQNMILLDGVQIFNPFHLGGFFSVFNADMVDHAELLSGGFPAEYGGRVSSVLTVESEAGDGTFKADGGASLLAARVAVGGGVPAGLSRAVGLESVRWRVSGRRSYFDQLSSSFPYRLMDGQGVLEAWTPGGSRLQITAYSGNDVIELDEETLNDDSSSPDSLDIPFQIDWKWGNDAVGARWTNPTSDGGFFEARTSFSRFDNKLVFTEEDVTFGTSIEAVRSGLDVERHLGRRWTLRSGLGTERLQYDNLLEIQDASFQDVGGRGWLHNAYLQANRESGDWLMEVGSRLDLWQPRKGDDLLELSPRIAVKRFFNDRNAAIKLATGRYTQFIHSLRDEEQPIGIDTWVLAGEQAPAVISNQLQVGYERYFGENWFASVEAYGRRFAGVTTINSGEDPNDATDDLLRGDGTSYGADAFVRRTGEGVTGWVSVSWLKAKRTFPDVLSGLVPAPDLTAPPIFDRRLDIDLVLRFALPGEIQSGVRWNLGTGLPYTRPIGKYGIYYPRGTEDGRLEASTHSEDDETEWDWGVVLGPRSSERYPTYSRLDLSFRRSYQLSWGRVTPHLDVLNVYNMRNPLFYYFNFEKTPPTRSGVSMFPFLPTFGVEVNF